MNLFLSRQDETLQLKSSAHASMIIPDYPQAAPLSLSMRPFLHPLFQQLDHGISELTFANLYLFRATHSYLITLFQNDTPVILGSDQGARFFIIPFGLPGPDQLEELFHRHGTMKCVSEHQAQTLESMGYEMTEDRDNFDYLYRREDLATLGGRKFHKKRNLIKAFLSDNDYEGKPLLDEYLPHALEVLEGWRENREDPGDYQAAREALEKSRELQLCGGIYYIEGKPAAYSLGEELARGTSFVIHFEKAISDYKGIWQFVNQAFASILPEQYLTINREQDLGDEGLRQAKLSYKPVGFVRKYRSARPPYNLAGFPDQAL